MANLLVIQATDEELETMTLAEIVAKAAAAGESKGNVAERMEPYSVEEAAEVLGVSIGAIYQRVKAETIRKVPHMGRVLIPAAEIKRLIA